MPGVAARPTAWCSWSSSLLDRPGYERFTALMDLQMLAVAGGRERTEAEFAALFARAGLRLTRVLDTGTHYAILEAVAG